MPILPLFAAFLATPIPAQSVQLNGELAPLPGSIRSAKSTPDGRMVLFIDAQGRLLSTDANGGPDELLATPEEHGEIGELQFDAQGSHATFWGHRNDEDDILWRVPVMGGAATRLGTSASQGSYLLLEERGVVVVRRPVGSRSELVSFSLAGNGSEVVLTPPEQNVNRFLRTHDGARIVFDDRISSTRSELFAVPPDGSSAPVRLSPSETEHPGRVDSFAVAGDRVAFAMGGVGLFTASLAPDTWIRLDRSAPAEGYVLSLDGRTLYVVDDYALGGKHELWRRATDGGAPERLNPSMPNQSGVKIWRLASDGHSIVYTADLVTVGAVRLHRLDLDTLETREIGQALPQDGRLAEDLAFVPGERHVTISVSGGSAPGRYALELASGRTFLLGSESFTPDGRHLVSVVTEFQPDTAVGRRLQVRSIDGGPTRTLARAWTQLSAGSTSDGSRMLFIGDTILGEAYHLHSVPIDGGRVARLNDEDPPGDSHTFGVGRFALSPDEKHALYLAQQEFPLYLQYLVPTDGSRDWSRIDRGILFGRDGKFTPDGKNVVLVGTTLAGQRLYRTPDGAGTLVPLTAAARAVSFQLEPSSRFAFARLFEGASDASATLAVRLADANVRTIEPAGIAHTDGASDGRALVYTADRAGTGTFELFSFDLASGKHRRLSHTLAMGTRVTEFSFATTSGRVAYATSEPGGTVLWIAPSDGSAPATPIPATTTGPASTLRPAPDGRAFYFGAPTAPGRFDLFRASATGGAAQNLSAASSGLASLSHFRTVPGDAHLLVLASNRGPLFSLATSGGTPVQLSEGRVHTGFVDIEVSPDGSTTYIGQTDDTGKTRILAVPVHGGPARVLSGAIDVGIAFGIGAVPRLSSDGRWLGFLVEKTPFDALLYAVPTDGSRAPILVHDAAESVDLQFVLGRTGIYYLGSGENRGFIGLFKRSYASLGLARAR